MKPRAVVCLAALAALSACGYRNTPAPVVSPLAQTPPGESTAPRSDAGTHVVKSGDTLSGLAERYGVGMAALAQANGLAPPYRIMVGQRLRIPDAAPAPAVAARPAERAVAPPSSVAVAALPPPAPSRPAVAAPPPARQAPTPPVAANGPAPRETVVATLPPLQGAAPAPPAAAQEERGPPAVAAETAAADPSEPSSPGSGRFLWPVEGKVVVGFGPQPGGLHNDGINIAAPRGTPVHAADVGTVAYAGNELGGFGNLLLIKHADGWITAYAHNDEILVKVGERVRRGQVVARVGSTGSANSPQLHFEVRRGERPVDPTALLSGNASVRSTAGPAGRPDPG
jgi:murein DD-endopeptidase MepM/ murein hydrolase activator NlpD